MTRKLTTVTGTLLLLLGVALLVGKGAEMRRATRNQALVQAVSEGDLEQAAALLQAGADARTRTPEGESLLFAADSAHDPLLLTALARRGLSLQERDALGLTVLHRAARRGDTAMLDAVLKLGQPVNELDARGRSALTLAVQAVHPEATRLLLTQGADVRIHPPGEPPLFSVLTADLSPRGKSITSVPASDPLARYRGRSVVTPSDEPPRLACVRELLRFGAAPDARDAAGASPVEVALARHYWKTARVLVEKLGGWRDPEGRTALRVAAELDNAAGVAELYQTRNRPGEGEPTELVLAAWTGDRPRLKTLLAHGIDPNRNGIPGRTVLGRAAERGDLEAVRALLAAHARTEQSEADGYTPLHVAAARCRTEVLRALLAAGAPLNARTKSGRTPLHEAAGIAFRPPVAGELQGAERVRARQSAVRLLLQHHADPNARDRRGATPLQEALVTFSKLDRTVVQLLLEHGGSVSGAGAAEAPLFAAVRRGDVPLATTLLAHGADLNERSRETGATPLWSAIWGDSPEMIQFLHGRGARLPETVARFGSRPSEKQTERVEDALQRRSLPIERRKLLAGLFPELRMETPAQRAEERPADRR
jgi:ankyrin repeat protein